MTPIRDTVFPSKSKNDKEHLSVAGSGAPELGISPADVKRCAQLRVAVVAAQHLLGQFGGFPGVSESGFGREPLVAQAASLLFSGVCSGVGRSEVGFGVCGKCCAAD